MPPHAPRSGTRRIVLDASGTALSALLTEPQDGAPRAVVVAVHGGGMTSGYFDAQARPDLSLMGLGPRLGFSVLAVDRPGYGLSAGSLPEGQTVTEQTALLRAALADFAARHPTGEGLFLLAHSFGGKLALSAAAHAEAGDRLLGLDVSGCGHRYAVSPQDDLHSRSNARRHWGPLRLYPPGTFRASEAVVAPMPPREQADIGAWPALFTRIAPRVRVPVRFTFAEYEGWWHHGEEDVAELVSHLSAAERVLVDRLPGAGHNISLGWAARAYHLRALSFLEECLLAV